MLPMLNHTTSRISKRASFWLIALALIVAAAPLVYVTRAPNARAEDPAANKAEEKAPASTPPAESADKKEAPAPTTNPEVITVAPAIKPAAEEFFPPLSEAEKKITAELNKETSLDFTKQRLQDVVDYLKELHGIEIVLDPSLKENGIGSDSPVTINLKGISLRSALRLMLKELNDLTFDIQNEVLLFMTKDVADAACVTRTYPVGNLLGRQGDDYEDLVKAITTTIAPQTWNEVGGPGDIVIFKNSKSLVIDHTREIHAEVLQLLRSLRSARDVTAATTASK